MCEAVVHLQAMRSVVPACWTMRFTMTPVGPMEAFGDPWIGEDELFITQHASLVTCPACRALVH